MRGVRNLFSPGRMVLALSLLITGFLLFSAGGNLIETFRLNDDESSLRSQVEQLHGQEKQLEQIREYLRTDEYIEFMARRVFGFVKPGESLVVVEAPAPTTEEVEPPPGQAWWERLFGR